MSDNEKDRMSEEDFLKQHLNNLERGGDTMNTDIPFNNVKSEQSTVSDSSYFNFPVKDLPCGVHYPVGTILKVRPANTKEIQEYSMVDDNNFYDIVEKMNGMLQTCVRIKYLEGNIGTYMDIKDQDRLFLIFMIRELTFQNGKSLNIKKNCSCGVENQIDIMRDSFVFHDVNEDIKPYFNTNTRTYSFDLINGKTYEMAPPNVGIQKAFTDYIVKKNSEETKPNVAFLKIIPFMLPGRSSITIEGIEAKLKEFETIDDVSFQFLNDVVGKMTFGIKELKKNCTSCGTEIHTPMAFPNGASGIFVVHDAFKLYIKK
jgi:hypothetical protein